MRFELKTTVLFLVTYSWATLLGGIVYEHLTLHPVYLSALPDSSVLVNGKYGLRQSIFWQIIHPVLVTSLVAAIALNWRQRARRKLLSVSAVVYTLVLLSTVGYFLPELMKFQNSPNLPNVSPTEWFARGQLWQGLSIIRGFVMFVGFLPLLFALSKPAEVSGELVEPRRRAS